MEELKKTLESINPDLEAAVKAYQEVEEMIYRVGYLIGEYWDEISKSLEIQNKRNRHRHRNTKHRKRRRKH